MCISNFTSLKIRLLSKWTMEKQYTSKVNKLFYNYLLIYNDHSTRVTFPLISQR